MCGIVFILDKSGGTVDPARVNRATESLVHRGPDDGERFFRENVALGFRRLSIVDVAGGQQPLLNEDGSIVLVCNGEIYNYRALREALLADGHRFRTNSDCETILHLYESDPTGFAARLDGMFAFVLIDFNRRQVLFGRDRVGIKPLFIHDGGRFLVVASEAKAILASGLVPFALDGQAIFDFFTFSYVPGRQTAFAGIETVEPATVTRIGRDGGDPATSAYWAPSFPKFAGNKFSPVGPFAQSLRTIFTQSVGSQLIGDLPVAAYLSGGIDSTVTAIVLKRALVDQARLKTFSIKFSDAEFDESAVFLQTIAANAFQAEILEAPPVDAGLFQRVLYHLEQPQSSLLDVPMFSLSRLVRDDGLKVILAGEGSDELFGGYFQFTLNQIRRALSLPSVANLKAFLLERVLRHYFADEEDRRQLGRILSADPAPVVDRFGTYPAWYPTWLLRAQQREGLFTDPFADSLGEGSAMHRASAPLKDRYAGIDDFNKSILLEMTTRLPNYILTRADRNSMAHSVELRVPFLSNAMIDQACVMPPMVKMWGLKEKYVLRQAFAALIPKPVRKRMKFGYNAPVVPFWQAKDELRDDMLSEASLRRTGLFAVNTVQGWTREAAATTDRRRQNDLYGRLTGVLSVQLLHDSFGRIAGAPGGPANPSAI